MSIDELNAIVTAARARQPDIATGKWVHMHGGAIMAGSGITPEMGWYDAEKRGKYVLYVDDNSIESAPADAALITAAPDLNAAVIALADELDTARARIVELEAKIAEVELLREQYAARMMRHLLNNPPK